MKKYTFEIWGEDISIKAYPETEKDVKQIESMNGKPIYLNLISVDSMDFFLFETEDEEISIRLKFDNEYYYNKSLNDNKVLNAYYNDRKNGGTGLLLVRIY